MIIFAPVGVILVSLIVASIALPLLTEKKEKSNFRTELDGESENEAQIKAMQVAIESVKQVRNDGNETAVASVISYYEQRIADLKMNRSSQDNNARNRELEIILHRHAVAVQLAYIQQLLKEGKVSREDARRLQAILRRVELVLTNRFRMLTMMLASCVEQINECIFPWQAKIRVSV